jgi:hypothetical protein
VFALTFWEYLEDAATAVVLVGVIGEYLAEFTRWGMNRKSLGKVSTLILIVGIAGELLAVVRTQQLSNREIAALYETAEHERLERLRMGLAAASRDVTGMLTENRWSGVEEHERLLRRRDDLLDSLRATGIEREVAEHEAGRITTLVDWDLRKAIAGNVLAAWHPIRNEDPTDASKRTAFQRRVELVLQRPERLTALDDVGKLVRQEPHITNFEQIDTSIRVYRGYVASGRLPKTGRADDLSRAPIE